MGIVICGRDLPIKDDSLRFIIVCVKIRIRFEMGAVGQIESYLQMIDLALEKNCYAPPCSPIGYLGGFVIIYV